MKRRLEDIVLPLERAPVECDGMSSLVATLLTKHGIPYRGMCGQITPTGIGIPIPHVWIEVDEWVIDLRARMWLGDKPEIPHGVFRKEDFSRDYEGRPVSIDPLPDFLFEILQVPFPAEILSTKQQKDSELEP